MPKQTIRKIGESELEGFFLTDKLAYAKAYAKKEGCIMDEKIKQFIIECLFNKYFEEKAEREIVVEQERVLVQG